MKSHLLSIILIGYNSKSFLKTCLGGVHHQTLKDIETIFIDNASVDDSVEFVKKEFPWARIIANQDNLGYAGGANQGIRETKSKYVMILNPDIIMPPDYLEKIIHKLEQDERIAAITGKILKYDFEHMRETDTFDTTGLYCYRNRRIIDRGQGSVDTGQYDDEEEVFGISGAVPVYRRSALEDIKLKIPSLPYPDKYYSFIPSELDSMSTSGGPSSSVSSKDDSKARGRRDSLLAGRSESPVTEKPTYEEYLDEDFFMYKEDVDVSWRLRLRGWKCYYYPKAVCYHGRGTGVLKRFTHWEVYKGRKGLSRFQKHYSYKNQRLMQIKNELWPNLLRDALWIGSKEFIIFIYILVKEPYLLKTVWQGLKQVPSALKKRKQIMSRRKVSAKEMGHWLSGRAKQ